MVINRGDLFWIAPDGSRGGVSAAHPHVVNSGRRVQDAVLYTDGGGKRRAALNPIFGADKIQRFIEGVAHKHAAPDGFRAVRINGLPGIVVHTPDDGFETMAIECDGEKIVAIYIVRNPDKLRHLS